MKRHHEQLLVAALAGLIILGGAAYVVQPTSAAEGTLTAPDETDGLGTCTLPPTDLTFVSDDDSNYWFDRSAFETAGGNWALLVDRNPPPAPAVTNA